MTDNLTPLESTQRHIALVQHLTVHLAKDIASRGAEHDASKLGANEWHHFERETPLLKTLTYGSPEYAESLKRLGPALQHHYQANRHHPEHHGDKGVAGMTLVDLVEMFCDWVAASQRTKDGTPADSITKSCERFKIPPMLQQILLNTVDVVKDEVEP